MMPNLVLSITLGESTPEWETSRKPSKCAYFAGALYFDNFLLLSWEEKLPMSKSALESTWLYHEIGRCFLELDDNEKAKDYGERSMAAAEEAQDDVWQLNSCVLIAQSQGAFTAL
jgi:hypothetical protein